MLVADFNLLAGGVAVDRWLRDGFGLDPGNRFDCPESKASGSIKSLNVDPELALRASSGRFVARVERAAELTGQESRDWRALDLEEQDRYYRLAKSS